MNLTLTSQYLLANVKAFQEALNSNDNYQLEILKTEAARNGAPSKEIKLLIAYLEREGKEQDK